MRFQPGTVLRVGIDEDWHTYARMAGQDGFIAFYDLRTSTDTEVTDLAAMVATPILFSVMTFPRAYSKGHWPKVGHVPIDDEPIAIPERFMQNISRPWECKILSGPGQMRAATPEECIGLERASVYDAPDVESRLKYHYAGVPDPQQANSN